jgi:hypothetical protein
MTGHEYRCIKRLHSCDDPQGVGVTPLSHRDQGDDCGCGVSRAGVM